MVFRIFNWQSGRSDAALLTTPKSGSEVRGALKKTANDVPNKLGDVLDDSLDLLCISH